MYFNPNEHAYEPTQSWVEEVKLDFKVTCVGGNTKGISSVTSCPKSDQQLKDS